MAAVLGTQQPGGDSGEGRVLGRHRRHQSPARDHVVKVLYAPAERAAVEQAAGLAALRPSSYVAWAPSPWLSRSSGCAAATPTRGRSL